VFTVDPGSIGFGDPDAEVGFGYVTNLWSFRIGEPRASSLVAAVVDCLGRASSQAS
jgi:hypothetical protein